MTQWNDGEEMSVPFLFLLVDWLTFWNIRPTNEIHCCTRRIKKDTTRKEHKFILVDGSSIPIHVICRKKRLLTNVLRSQGKMDHRMHASTTESYRLQQKQQMERRHDLIASVTNVYVFRHHACLLACIRSREQITERPACNLSAQWKPGYHGPVCQGPQRSSEDYC